MNVKNEKIKRIIDTLSQFLQGKEEAIRLSLITFFSKGHLLIEDLPGLGKTTLAVGIARALGLSFGRIQFTSDLLPSDIIGVSVFKREKGEFEFQKGPIFNNIILVDETNRATPKTQSALLEAMGEKQVSVEGKTYKLEKPFFVIATQNPVEQYGTFPLPESQLDRFMLKISVGYPVREAEKEILKGGSKREELYKLEPILTKEEALKIQNYIRNDIYISDKVIDYILDVVEITRRTKFLHVGLSIRGSLALMYTAKANAYFSGRDYVIPEDVKELSIYTIPHRVIFKEEFEEKDKKEIIKTLIEEVKMPV